MGVESVSERCLLIRIEGERGYYFIARADPHRCKIGHRSLRGERGMQIKKKSKKRSSRRVERKEGGTGPVVIIIEYFTAYFAFLPIYVHEHGTENFKIQRNCSRTAHKFSKYLAKKNETELTFVRILCGIGGSSMMTVPWHV